MCQPATSDSPGNNAASRSEAVQNRRWSGIAVCFLLVLAVWAVFGQTLRHEFINYDDPDYVSQNPAVARGISWDGAVWAFTHRHSDNWHPLTTLSHMLDCQAYGLNPAGHHLTSVLLHAATAVLLFLVLRSMTGALCPAACVAAVFAIHPLRVESVAWVSERKDVLSGLFFMLTLWAYARHAQKQKAASQTILAFLTAPFYWLALAFFAAGLMSKPMLVTLPFVLLLLDYWPLNRLPAGCSAVQGWWRLGLEKIPFLLLAVGSCVATVWAQHNVIRSAAQLAFPWRIGNAMEAYVAYLGQTIWPTGLAVFYPHPKDHLSVVAAVGCVLGLAVITAGAVAARRQHPYLLVGWLWYLGMLVPVIGLMQVGEQARADRYTYLPQIGLSFALVWVVHEGCRSWRWRRTALTGAIVLILAGLAGMSYAQTKYWNNSLSLWTHALAVTGENGVALVNYGVVLASQGKLDEAVARFERALRLDSRPSFFVADACFNLGNALVKKKQPGAAIPYYERALLTGPDKADVHINLGIALLGQKQWDAAAGHFAQAARLQPDSVLAQYNWGNALSLQGDFGGAIRHFQQSLNLAVAQNDAGLAETIRARLKSSQANLPKP